MGAWDELDVLITADSDTLGLEELIDVCSDSDFDDIFEPAITQAEKWIDAIEEGTELGLEITANNLISMEQTEILDTGKHPYSQGILGTSIDKEEQGDGWLVGTNINHIYQMSVEYGADIYPVEKPFLQFQLLDGSIRRAYEVHQTPKPFVQPAFERMVDKIENEGYGVFRSVCGKMDQAIM